MNLLNYIPETSHQTQPYDQRSGSVIDENTIWRFHAASNALGSRTHPFV
jgi:hypothetical protein